ncbi:F-box/kelch-repeat protein [Senna tora]|uniref:F-box/kelch-repeat protein n=1 Tax=Senna tora TaxID=362788 RepID=A0A834TT92_9FABA|nr:F-box/kelch-repeat protein [Senna tora]
MLDGRSCVVSRLFPSSCQAENKWSYMSYLRDVKNSKRLADFEGEEDEPQPRKSAKMFDSCPTIETAGIVGEQQSCQAKDALDSCSVIHQMDQNSSTIPEQKSHECLSSDHRVEKAEALSDQLCDEQQQHQAGDAFDFGGQQSDEQQQQHAGDSSDSGSLLPRMNRDSSIACLSRCSRSDYGSLASLNKSFRNLIRSGELYTWRRLNGIIEHWVYFSCALLEWEAYDPIRQRWMHLPRMASNECFMCSDKESLAVGTELLVFGRELTSHVIYRYSLLTNSWSSGMRMNAPRCLFGSASLGEIAILAGGCDSDGRILSSAELYNSENQTWETLPSMNKPRKMCSGIFMDGKFYVIGGIGGSDCKVLTCGEEYNLQTRTWTEIPNMSPGRSSRGTEMPATAEAPPLVAVVNNELYAANYADMEVKKYDKERKLWLTIGRLPERVVSMNGWGLAFRACGNRLIVIGGPRTHGEGFIELNSWVPSEGPPQWNLLARKRSGNFVYNCAVMGC